MNIPNAITILRVLLVPFLLYFLLRGEFREALWVLLAAGISDALDGVIARRFNMMTELGALLDPLADKILIIASVLALASTGLLPRWLAALIILRDLIIMGGATAYYLRAGRLQLVPTIPGKANTFVLICTILFVLVTAAGLAHPTAWLPLLFGCSFITTIFSGVHYVVVWGQKAANIRVKGEG
ncbi:MAG TPA: CDP-alcohol phosphatidyltransferase family protein [Geobacteraceae bacterium]